MRSLYLIVFSLTIVVSGSNSVEKTATPLKNPTVKISSLKSSEVSEGSCVVDPAVVFVNPLMWLYPRTYYIPVASEYAFRRFAEIYLGRPAKSDEELEKMCLTIDVFGMSFKTNGYGEFLGQSCHFPSWDFITSLNWATLRCEPNGVSNDIVQKSLVDDYVDHLVMTDNETFGMYVRCVNGVKDFKVLTTTPEVSEELLIKIKEKAVSLGFNGKYVRKLLCKKKDTDQRSDSKLHQEL